VKKLAKIRAPDRPGPRIDRTWIAAKARVSYSQLIRWEKVGLWAYDGRGQEAVEELRIWGLVANALHGRLKLMWPFRAVVAQAARDPAVEMLALQFNGGTIYVNVRKEKEVIDGD
jgi:hypothetical protein